MLLDRPSLKKVWTPLPISTIRAECQTWFQSVCEIIPVEFKRLLDCVTQIKVVANLRDLAFTTLRVIFFFHLNIINNFNWPRDLNRTGRTVCKPMEWPYAATVGLKCLYMGWTVSTGLCGQNRSSHSNTFGRCSRCDAAVCFAKLQQIRFEGLVMDRDS